MHYPIKTFVDLETIAFKHEDLLFEAMGLHPDDVELTDVTFSSSTIHVYYWYVESGQHVHGSIPVSRFITLIHDMEVNDFFVEQSSRTTNKCVDKLCAYG